MQRGERSCTNQLQLLKGESTIDTKEHPDFFFFFAFVLQDTKFPSLSFATKKVTIEDCCLCQLDYFKMVKAHLMHLPEFRLPVQKSDSP